MPENTSFACLVEKTKKKYEIRPNSVLLLKLELIN